MAVLLVTLSVMAIMMTAAMPVWKHEMQREREAELIFRGQQYVRAIALFQRKAGPGVLPPSIDLLVQQRFLREKYKDPITGEDFVPVVAGQASALAGPGGQPTGRGASSGSQAGAAAGNPRSGTSIGRPLTGTSPIGGPVTGITGGAGGGIIGVQSKSTERSIRLYNGRSHYNEWVFVLTQQTQAPGVVPGATGAPGIGPGPGGTPRPGGVAQPDGRGRGGRGPGGTTRPDAGRGDRPFNRPVPQPRRPGG